MIDKHNEWWTKSCERAERITARQIGVPDIYAFGTEMRYVRKCVDKLMAPKAANNPLPRRPASLRTRMLLAATNQRRAELGQPLISFN